MTAPRDAWRGDAWRARLSAWRARLPRTWRDLPARWYARLYPHLIPLLLAFGASMIGQAATLVERPLVTVVPDTPSYVLAAQRIAASPAGLIETFRTPGYPLFLALIFKLSGGVNYARALGCQSMPASAYCASTFTPIVVAQTFVWLLTICECYVLASRLSGRRWVACAVGVALGLNLYLASWERLVLSEVLAVWAVVTAVLCFERFVRDPGRRWGILFGVSALVAVLVRPANLIVPIVLLGALLARWLWRGELRARWGNIALSGAVVAVGVLGYMTLDARLNGYFGLSLDQNINLLGKVIEYDMESLPTAPRYQGIQTALRASVAHGQSEPWVFSAAYPPASADSYQLDGAYASYMIRTYPGDYLRHAFPDFILAWRAPVRYYASYSVPDGGSATRPHPFGAATAIETPQGLIAASGGPPWLTLLFVLTWLEQSSYVLLPVLALALAYRLWRRPAAVGEFVQVALLLAIVGLFALIALASYDEFSRIRYVLDWAMILVTILTLGELGGALWPVLRAAIADAVARWRAVPGG